jgi:hypothetical protein
MYCEAFSAKEDASAFSIGSWKQNDRCSYCGRQTPVPLQLDEATGQVFNRPADARVRDRTALPLEFIRSGHEWWGSGGESSWRHTWPGMSEAEGEPVGVTAAALADPVYAIGRVDARLNWSTVEWVCTHPGVGHSVSADHPNIERFRTPASATYVRNWCEKCVFSLERDVDELTVRALLGG